MYSSEDKFYCYPNSSTLRNLLGIRDATELAEVEGYIVGLRMAEVVGGPSSFAFSFEHLKELHRRLFRDVFEWAGETRQVDLAKGDTRFAVWQQIESVTVRLFESTAMESAHSSEATRQWFVDTAAPFLVELNVIHPFRDGNGRTMRLFVELWASSIGLQLEWHRVEPEKIVAAMIHGVTEDASLARDVLNMCVVRPEFKL